MLNVVQILILLLLESVLIIYVYGIVVIVKFINIDNDFMIFSGMKMFIGVWRRLKGYYGVVYVYFCWNLLIFSISNH